ncbi:MAG: single-stranded DNA-binding protein [Candidatus Thiodiazotropha endolucinida]
MTDICGPARLAANPELKPVGEGEDKRFVCVLRARFLNFKPKKNSDDYEDNGFWADVNVWDKFAEPAAKMLVKGDRIIIGGNLVQNHWPDKDDPETERSRLKVDATFIAPFLPDIEELRYKPRGTQQGQDSDDTVPVTGDLADVS